MGNTTTVNIIISTVDYLLRLQVRKKQGKMEYNIFTFSSFLEIHILLESNMNILSSGVSEVKNSDLIYFISSFLLK